MGERDGVVPSFEATRIGTMVPLEPSQRRLPGVYFALRNQKRMCKVENLSQGEGLFVKIREHFLDAKWFCALCCLLFVALGGSAVRAQGQDRAPEYYPADIQYGAQIFSTQCTTCHGTSGDLIPGVNFRAGVFKRVVSDNDLRATITNGVPGTGMLPFAFGASELTGIVSYLRNMSTLDGKGIMVGNVARGHALFTGAGNCSGCHAVNGKGPRVAPDLGDVGNLRTADLLHRTLIDPAGSMLPVNRSVHAVTKDGKSINGRRLNEDTYTVQLIDEQEHLVSLTKSDLREFTVLKITTMPSYKDKFSAQEQADVEAYLLSLKGVK
jgi:putative heme-binding domain-containing protein